jgi:predicted RNase H-like nuclease (RuvC/YqgF family)
MPSYKIRINLPNQIPYQLVLDVANATQCREGVLVFLRALGVASNVLQDFENKLVCVVHDHKYNYTLTVNALPPVEPRVTRGNSNISDLQIIANKLGYFNVAVGGPELQHILRALEQVQQMHKNTVNDLNDQIRKLKSEKATLSEKNADLRSEFNKKEKQLTDAQQEHDDARAKAQQEIDTAKENLTNERSKNREMDTTLIRIQEELDKVQSLNAGLRAENETLSSGGGCQPQPNESSNVTVL